MSTQHITQSMKTSNLFMSLDDQIFELFVPSEVNSSVITMLSLCVFMKCLSWLWVCEWLSLDGLILWQRTPSKTFFIPLKSSQHMCEGQTMIDPAAVSHWLSCSVIKVLRGWRSRELSSALARLEEGRGIESQYDYRLCRIPGPTGSDTGGSHQVKLWIVRFCGKLEVLHIILLCTPCHGCYCIALREWNFHFL